MSIIKNVFLVFLLATLFVLLSPLVMQSKLYTVVKETYQDSKPLIHELVKLTEPPPLGSDDLINLINLIRSENQRSFLKSGKQTCQLLNEYQATHTLEAKRITAICPSCQKVHIISLSEPISTDSAREYFESDATTSAILLIKDYTHICAKDVGDQMLVTLVSSVAMPSEPVTTHRTITEDELWKSLSEYRKDQGRSQLSLDEKLCVYARKRVDDHLKLLAEKKPRESYPVPAKYPLDAHAGFKADADSGYVFETTGKSEVAENLAYWPNAEYATHVIEWGWDQSKEGHRETQLSNDFNSACLTGKAGFFVAIFGR